ncbi:MAG: hypothetical protein IPJ65_18625 [Archangiaceae bacterium]|nr:hypothetical protein [Archangiaceae bacterium]
MKHTFVLPLVALFSFAACDGGTTTMDAGNDGPDTTCSSTPEAVTMVSLQTDLFDPKCKSCHYKGTGGAADGTGYAYGDYETAAQTYEMVGKASLYNKMGATTLKIVDSDTTRSTAQRLAASTLWLKCASTKSMGFKGPNNEITGATMPQNATMLTAAELQKIKDWICRGAPMN